MRLGVLIVGIVGITLAGCGRFGFDALGGGDGGIRDDGASDGTPAGDSILLAVNADRVITEQFNFPALVRITDARLAGANEADLRFTDEDGDVIAHEVESFEGSGALTAWVKLPRIDGFVDVPFRLYYEPTTVPARPAAEVWEAYAAVFHFGPGQLERDSAGGDAAQVSGNPGSDTGRVDTALALTGVSDTYLKHPATGLDTAPGGTNTMSYWMFYTGAAGRSPVTASFTDCGGSCDYDMWWAPDDCFGFNTAQDEIIGVMLDASYRDRWVYVVGTFINGTPTTSNVELYLDGVRQTLTACRNGPPASRTFAGPIYIGGYRSYELIGRVDEVRVSPAPFSGPWIDAEFANQSDPEAFIRVLN